MSMRRTCGGLAAMLVASSAFADVALADTMTMWVRVSGTNAAAHLVDLWNATHGDKIELYHHSGQPDGDQARHGRPGRRGP